MRERAGRAFVNRQDAEANLYRRLADEFDAMGQARRDEAKAYETKNPPDDVPEED